jgi:glutamate dehydrogenase/leucine dehydrogenase
LLGAQREGGRLDRGQLSVYELAERDALFAIEADLLVLGAASHSVDEAQADRICARQVVEGANFGLTDAARSRLSARRVQVIPDVLANSSSAAMVARQMFAGNGLSDGVLWGRIEEAIQEAVRGSAQEAKATGETLRQAWVRLMGG